MDAMIHVASISSTNPQGSSGAYSVSKAGVVIMSKQLAFELGLKAFAVIPLVQV
jgi:NAD(P)-dependent dehydrogenase (short-subunit alcohol dehydrogenase family)